VDKVIRTGFSSRPSLSSFPACFTVAPFPSGKRLDFASVKPLAKKKTGKGCYFLVCQGIFIPLKKNVDFLALNEDISVVLFQGNIPLLLQTSDSLLRSGHKWL